MFWCEKGKFQPMIEFRLETRPVMRPLLWLLPVLLGAQTLHVGRFAQEVRTVLETAADVRSLTVDSSGTVWGAGAAGVGWFDGAKWTAVEGAARADLAAFGGGATWFT